MKRGLTLVQLIFAIGIVGLLGTMTESALQNKKSESINKTVSTTDKIENTASVIYDDNISNSEHPCDRIPDATAKRECEDGIYTSKMIQECIQRYQ